MDTTSLSRALNNPHSSHITTNATKSIRSPVENLASNFHHENLTEELEKAIAAEFGGFDIIDVQPSEENFKGLDKIIAGYKSWSWIFGKSPKFDVTVENEKFTISNGMISIDKKELPFDRNLLEYLNNSCYPNHKLLANLIKDIL